MCVSFGFSVCLLSECACVCDIVLIEWSSWEHISFLPVYNFFWGQGLPGYTDDNYYGFSIIATEWSIQSLKHTISQKGDNAGVGV